MAVFLRTIFTAALAAALVMTPGATRQASAGDSGRYVSGGTAAARVNGQPVADEGSVVCDNGDGVGAGGMCLKFGGGNAVAIADEALGENVAFQVCLDNNGDGICTSPDFGFCADEVFFSHSDNGTFANPLGPLPTGFAAGCAGGPWKGYVVFLCEGAHAVGIGANAHTHPSGSGTGRVTSGGEGTSGTFCGGTPVDQSRKPYKVGSGGRYVSAATAAARADGQPLADEGAMSCNGGDNNGVGGFCTSFGGGNAISVLDDVAGADVAFQVCIDNSGDGICTSPDSSPFCADEVFFSHDDDGSMFNPVGPLPTGFRPGCGGNAWNGYVVFLCEGTHVAGLAPHAHAATTGVGRVTTGGEGLGDFCGGTHSAPSGKRYRPAVGDLPNPAGLTSADGICVLRAAAPDGFSQTNEGFIEGTATAGQLGGGPADPASLRCFVAVDGSEVTSSTTATGVGVVTVPPQPVSFAATRDNLVQVCAAGATPNGSYTSCVDATGADVLPQAVADAVAAVEDSVPPPDGLTTAAREDLLVPIFCPILPQFAGSYGPVRVDADGDVHVDTRRRLDCPPFGN